MCGEVWLLRLLLFHLLDTLQSQPPFTLKGVQCLCPLEGRRVRKGGARNSETAANEETCLIWILPLGRLADLDC